MKDRDGGGVVLSYEGKPADVLDRVAGCRNAVLTFASARGTFYRKDILEALKGQFSRRVVDPVLKALSKEGYPLKADEVRSGRTTQRFYTFINGEPEPQETDGDVPF